MSTIEILSELPKLTTAEREEIRLRLAELGTEDWLDDGTLTKREKALIEERFRELDAAPGASISWSAAKLVSAFGR